MCCVPFFVAKKITKLKINYISFELVKKKFGPIYKELQTFLPKKLSFSSLKYGFGIQDPEKTYYGSQIQGSKRHRIQDLDPRHWFFFRSRGRCCLQLAWVRIDPSKDTKRMVFFKYQCAILEAIALSSSFPWSKRSTYGPSSDQMHGFSFLLILPHLTSGRGVLHLDAVFPQRLSSIRGEMPYADVVPSVT